MAHHTNIIAANICHVEAMAHIFQQGQKPHHERFPDIFGPADNVQAIISYMRGFLKPRNPFREQRNFAIVWQDEGKVGGYLLYQLYQTSNIFYGKDHWVNFVEDIAVDESVRGKGVASQLMDYMADVIEDCTPCIASANVWRGNEASEALFEKYGYSALSKTYYRTNQ